MAKLYTFALLKKYLIILLVGLYCLSATELNQLLKLPVLFSHFEQHQTEDEQITLWEFLCLHYQTPTERDADYHEDMKLPFKSPSNFLSNISLFNPFNQTNPLIDLKVLFIDKSYKISPEVFISSASINSIWQPPKSV